ncbi:DNA dC-_dU-editing enzyme APOBEC-3F-like [Artibeus jamaicensis]|uniref:DNA dC->dU-editing enzyme APOBEC-3F-like n=1 Tax=Artibeus jamaicensis TaxID=9417 RepID=UPI00235A8B9F|nr:DNA dC->dU-editing enzyme APOBEC-3F-like [Artibeus jamaicensis]
METGPAPLDRPRMDMATFAENFSPQMLKETHLCYEWDVPEGDSRIPVDQMKGFLRNKGADTLGEARHAELCFLDLIPSWGLDKNEHYSVTLFISWSPCPDCARSLVAFLLENGHLSLRIFAARIYSKNWGYEDGLRQLQAAGAEVSIMSIDEYQHCWEAFVDHQGGPFQPHPKLHKHIQGESQRLEGILRARSPPCSPPAPLPPHLLSLFQGQAEPTTGTRRLFCMSLCILRHAERAPGSWACCTRTPLPDADSVRTQREACRCREMRRVPGRRASAVCAAAVTCDTLATGLLEKHENVCPSTVVDLGRASAASKDDQMRSLLGRKADPVLGTMVRRKVSWKKGYIPKPWPSNPMEKLYADYFNFHFTNELTPPGRNGCYICYEVQGTHSLISLKRGVFENQFYPKKRVHAEVCFLNWFKKWPLEKTPTPGEPYRVTWYMSWSPCVECAKQVADFLNTQKCVQLRITFSRLYHSNKPEYRQGLRHLAGAGAELAVMSPEDFKRCWSTFVSYQESDFRPWSDLDENSEKLSKMLDGILRIQGS